MADTPLTYHALIVESDGDDRAALEELVRAQGFVTSTARTIESARALIEQQAPDLAVLDIELPDGNGLDLIEPLTSGLQAEIVIVTEDRTAESAVEALQAGVADYLTRPLDPQELKKAAARVKRTLRLKHELHQLRGNLRRLGRFDRIVGRSPAMQEVYDLIGRVAPMSSTVLVVGETGAGKDLVAETIHRRGPRSRGPFVPVNCGALQDSLIESELFGHEAGSFTGANRVKKGLFEQARGGTLFLDEITEMPPEQQVNLLRVLENRELRRVGGDRRIPVDVRLIAATNRSPERSVREGELREDLYFRLSVFPIRVPPLRKRVEDIPLLAAFFLEQVAEDAGSGGHRDLSSSALKKLRQYDWPGNVRELRNVLERAFILSSDEILPEHVQLEPEGLPSASTARVERPSDEPLSTIEVEIGSTIKDMERRLILATLDACDGEKKRAAKTLGISVKTLYNRLNVYGHSESC